MGTYSVSSLLSSFAFPYSMAFDCIQKNLHCHIHLVLDICFGNSYGSSFLCSVILLVSFAYFLDVQIYNLHLILSNSYNIAYCNILLGVSFYKSLYFCILQFPLYFYTYFYAPVYIFLRIYIYLYFPNMCNFLGFASLFWLLVLVLGFGFFVLVLGSGSWF